MKQEENFIELTNPPNKQPLDLSELLKQNYERYCKILGPLECSSEQYEELVRKLWDLSCQVARYCHEEEIPQSILYTILEKACQDNEKDAMNQRQVQQPNSSESEGT